MLLLALDGLLLLFVSAGMGICMLECLQKIFKQAVFANTLGVILAGLILSNIYFSIISFWLPVNYIALVPLVIISGFVFGNRATIAQQFIASVKNQLQVVFSKPAIYAVVPVCLMLAYCWLLPPVNADSPGYHYATILWFEKYKVVPGLANVDGRLAYNSAAFIIQSAFAFTNVFGQSVYPLNGLLVTLLFLWIVYRILKAANIYKAIVYFLFLYLFNRVLLVNMSSPTSDVLLLVCLVYAIMQLFDALLYKRSAAYFLLPLVILLYAITAKLSAYPVLLLVPLILWHIRQEQKTFMVLMRISVIGVFIYLPWLCRNVILSGYLLYPVPFIDIFSFDWKAPKDLLLLDYTYIKRLPINFDDNMVRVAPPPFPHWVMPWVQRQLNSSMRSDLFIFFAAICSPLYWIFVWLGKAKIEKPVFYCWAILYTCVLVWLANVPEYRFGIIFIGFAFIMPFMYWASVGQWTVKLPAVFTVVLFVALSAYYVFTAAGNKNVYAFSLQRFLVYPLKDKQYYFNNDTATFNYTILNSGIRLYHQDSTHNCINTSQPCMIWKYGVIEMRGQILQDGFRNVRDDVGKNYPFVK